MSYERYVEMSARNKNLTHPTPVGNQKILIFDIDYCLYKSTAMFEHESATVKQAFLDLSQSTEDCWLSHISSFNLFREIFFKVVGMDLLDFSEKYERPEMDKFLSPDSELKELLGRIKLRMFCFTNACKYRAQHVLKYLGLEDVFEAVICADTVETEFLCKPMKESYEFLEKYLGISDPKNVYFFDDTVKNVENARKAGWNAIHVAGDLKDEIQALSKDIALL